MYQAVIDQKETSYTFVEFAVFVDIFFKCLQPGTSRPLQKVGSGSQLVLGTQFSPEKSLPTCWRRKCWDMNTKHYILS